MEPTGLRRQLDAGLDALGIVLTDRRRAALIAYIGLVAKWNRVFNLTAVREAADMVPRHLLDSLAILPHLDGETLLDVGTGAGLPGIPLAIAQPELGVTLLDASAKRTRFLTQAVAELGLSHVQVVTERLEDFRVPIGFANVAARAFSDIPQLARLARPLLAPAGRILAMKGRAPTAELDKLDRRLWTVQVHALVVPALDAQRHLVVLAPHEHAGATQGSLSSLESPDAQPPAQPQRH
jgi:16S rRNA (guanine527-N7)-methyltransferase